MPSSLASISFLLWVDRFIGPRALTRCMSRLFALSSSSSPSCGWYGWTGIGGAGDTKKEGKESVELEKYWQVVRNNPADFTGWTYLLQYVEQEVSY